jgi:hypothetical protein
MVLSIFFRLTSCFSTLVDGSIKSVGYGLNIEQVEHAHIDHVHHSQVQLFLHASLLLLKLAHLIPQLSNIKVAEIILQSCLTK